MLVPYFSVRVGKQYAPLSVTPKESFYKASSSRYPTDAWFQNGFQVFYEGDQNGQILLRPATVPQAQGKHAEAVYLFENAPAIYRRAFIYHRLAQSLQASGTKAKALGACEKALAFAPGRPKKRRTDAEIR